MAQRNFVFAAGLIASFGLPAVPGGAKQREPSDWQRVNNWDWDQLPQAAGGSSVDAVPVTAATLTTPISTAIATCPLVSLGLPNGWHRHRNGDLQRWGWHGRLPLPPSSTFTSVIPGTATLTAGCIPQISSITSR